MAENAGKNPVLSGDERCDLVSAHLKILVEADKVPDTVSVKRFSTLLTDFAASEGVTSVVRGLRAVSDFEYEFQMASINKRLHGELETVFLMAAEQQHFVASRFVKEVARYGGDISSFVPNDIALALKAKLNG